MRVLTMMAVAGLIALATMAPAGATSSDRLGGAGAQHLRVPVGARGTALSGSVIHDVSGVEALYWNPAGVTGGEGTELLFSSMSYLVDTDVIYVGAAQHFGQLFSLGLAFKSLSLGDIPVTTEAIGGPTGETFSPSHSVVGLTLGRSFSERVAFGFTANVVSESVRNVGATGVAFDFGFQYDPAWHGVRVGAVLKNFGPKMKFSGSDFGTLVDFPDTDPSAQPRSVVTESSAYELPSTFLIGVGFDAHRNESGALMVTTAFQSNSFSEDEYRFGAEYDWRNTFVLRGGTVTSSQSDYSWGYSFGGGARADLGGWRAFVDYTRRSTSDYFDDQNLISVRLQF